MISLMVLGRVAGLREEELGMIHSGRGQEALSSVLKIGRKVAQNGYLLLMAGDKTGGSKEFVGIARQRASQGRSVELG